MQFNDVLKHCPLIAILRGITPADIIPVAEVIVQAGFLCIEVAMNSPQATTSIGLLSKRFGEDILIGAGTLTRPEQVIEVAQAGAKLILSPHTDPAIITTAKELALFCVAGFSTPTEAFTAIHAGTDALKIFPAPIPSTLRSIKTVLPNNLPIIAVGGINPDSLVHYLHAGAAGFGIGNHLYQAGDQPPLVKQNAKLFYDGIHALL